MKAENTEHVREKINELQDTGIALGRRGSLNEALEHFDDALELCRRHQDGSVDMNLLTGFVYANKGATLGDMDQYDKAVECYDAAMEQYGLLVKTDRAYESIRPWLIALMNKGWALLNLGRDDEGLACHEGALQYLRDIRTNPPDLLAPELARTLYNVGEGYIRTKRLQQALPQYEQALEIWGKLIAGGRTEFEEDVAYAVSSMADVHAQLGNLPEALKLCDKAIAEFTRLARLTENPKLASAVATTSELRDDVQRRIAETR
jgi:tetratricopeptide (TPR) repeat protein